MRSGHLRIPLAQYYLVGLKDISIHISNKFPNTDDMAVVRPSTAHRFMSTGPWSDVIPQSTQVENKHFATSVAI